MPKQNETALAMTSMESILLSFQETFLELGGAMILDFDLQIVVTSQLKSQVTCASNFPSLIN